MQRPNELRQGIGRQRQIKTGTLRHNARLAQYIVTGEKPSIPSYPKPGRGVQGESSN